MLVFLIDCHIDDSEEMTYHLARRTGEDVRVPDADDLVVAARGDDVGVGTEGKAVDSLGYAQRLARSGKKRRGKKI